MTVHVFVRASLMCLGFCAVFSPSPSPAFRPDLPEKISAGIASSSSADIMKIARGIADELLEGPGAPRRLVAGGIGLFRKAAALNPKELEPDDHSRLGRLYLVLSESYADEAQRYLELALASRERDADRMALGNALLYQNDASGARREYLKVSESRPEDMVLAANLAQAERLLGDTSSALSRFRRIRVRTANPEVRREAALSIADMELAVGNIAEAKAQVESVLRTNGLDRAALMLMKRIYEREGRADLAKSLDRHLGMPAAGQRGSGLKGENR